MVVCIITPLSLVGGYFQLQDRSDNFYPEDGGSRFLGKIGNEQDRNVTLHSRENFKFHTDR
jgi:hypothetical protein